MSTTETIEFTATPTKDATRYKWWPSRGGNPSFGRLDAATMARLAPFHDEEGLSSQHYRYRAAADRAAAAAIAGATVTAAPPPPVAPPAREPLMSVDLATSALRLRCADATAHGWPSRLPWSIGWLAAIGMSAVLWAAIAYLAVVTL